MTTRPLHILRRAARLLAVCATVFSATAWAGVDWLVNNDDTGYDPTPANGDIIYTVRVSNNGTTAALSTTLTLSIPATTSYVGASGMSCSGTGPVSCTVPALAAAGGAGDNATVLVTIRTTLSGNVTLGASVPTAGDDDATNNVANQTTTVTAGADIALSLSGPASAQSGSTVSYTFTALNNGPDAASNLSLSFPIPTGLTAVTPPAGCSLAAATYTCAIAGPLANGASLTRVFSGQIAAASPSTLTPSGSITVGSPPDLIVANNTATFNTTVTAGSDLRITKSRAPAGVLLVGQAVTFTLTPTYTGDSPSGLTITDTIPVNYTVGAVASPQNGWTCGVAGQTVTCTKAAGSGAGAGVALGTITIPVTVASAGVGIVNSATINAASPSDPNPANNIGNDGGATIQTPTVDLRANKSGPNPALVVVGNTYSFAISATNLGNAAFFGTAVMTDALPAGLTVNSYTLNGWACLPAAPVVGPATISCQRTYTAGATLAAGATTPAVTLNTTATGTGSIVNSMTVSSPDANIADTNPANDTATYTVTGSIGGDAADISVVKTANPATVAAGDVLTYTLEVANIGPQPSTSITLTDNFTSLINNLVGAAQGYVGHTVTANAASGIVCSDASTGSTSRQLTCTIASLPVCTPGLDCPVIQVQVRPGGNGGNRTNTANAISSATADPDLVNNTGSVTSTVDPRADVTVSKTATPASVPAGQNLTYVVTATNIANGLSAAANVTITDTLPNDVTFISAAPSAGSCGTTPTVNTTTGVGNNQVICNLGTINNGAQRTVTIVVRPNTVTRGSTLTNNVDVATTTTETNGGNNSANASTPVTNPSLDLLINKTDSVDPLAVGDNTVYTVTVTNLGPSAAESVVITDTLPTRLSFQSNTVPAGGACPTVPAVGSTGGTLICQVPYLAAGQSRSFTVTMQGVSKGVDANTVSVTSTEVAAGFDTNAGNNNVSQATTVRTKADLQVVSKIPSVTPVNLREDFNFVVKVRNNVGAGLAEADNVVVSDTLPAGMELTGTPTVAIIAGTTTATTCTGVAGNTAFSCTLGTVSSGGEVDITVPVQVVSTTSSPQTFNNTATVTTTSLDTVPANNSNSGSVVTNSSVLAGRVFRDFNNDGLVTAGDTGITGITMTLTGTSFDGAPINRTVTTDASGNYAFNNLPQGTYSITEGAVAEAHLTDGTDTAGSAGGNTAVNDTISAINLPASTPASGYNFAEVPQARIGIAKQVSVGPTNNADGTFNVTFSLVVRNLSLEALDNVTVTDPLAGAAPLFGTYNAGALGNGEYKIVSAPSGTCAGPQAGFTGAGGSTTVAITPNLAAGASCTLSFAVQVKPTAPLPPVSGLCGARYCNQASVSGTGTLSGQTPTDLSDNGANPDTNGNGIANEAGENDPTPVAPAFNAAIGIAKQVNGNVSVQSDGSLLVPIRLVATNVGNEPLDNVSITDPLASGAGGQFGGYVAGGPAATLAAGQYTVQTGPAFSGACTNGAVVPAYTGASGNLALATITAMATTATCTVDFTFRFLPATLTTHTNQAQASGAGAYTGTPANDLSDDGANPDPNGNGNPGEAGENDPTPIPVPRIGVAKQVGGVVNNGDGTYNVPFTLTVRNYGQTPLGNVQITDVIAGALPQFGTYTASAVPAAGQYTIASGPTVGAQANGAALTAVAAGVFTGSGGGTALLVAGSSSLPNFGASASSAQITFTVRFFPTTQGPFNNSAAAAGSPPGGGTVTDNSVAGGNPDANGNGDPADDASPTVVSLNAQSIGVAKSVSGIVQTGAKRYRIPYTIIVRNVSAGVTATNVQVTDDLTVTFPTATTRIIAAPAAVSACTGTVLNANAAFTGTGINTLLAGNQNLQPAEQCTIRFTVEVDFGANPLPAAVQNNQAVATTAQTPGGTVIATDLSDDGSVPDANGNGNANESGENDPTPVSFAAGNLSSVSGTVYLDANHNRSNDDPLVSSRVQGFIVEVLNAAGAVVGTATTDASGNYTVGGLFPSTPGDASTYYAVRFREPVSGAIYGIPQSSDPTPARNGTISNGVITGLQLVAGVTTLEQNLPLDPSGVIYDSITRAPVAGAQVTLTFGGAPVPDGCLVGAVNTQTTGGTGQYQFLLINPTPPGCPGSGTYTIQVVQPAGYLAPPSAIIPPTAGPYTPTNGGVDAIQAQAGPPTGAAPTTYYFSFVLTVGLSSQVVNNHIPLDPILGGAIALSKTTPLVNVARGDLVPYTITATNTLAANLPNIDVVDLIPAGFRYRSGSATLNAVPSEPTINGRQLTWRNQSFTPNERKIIKLILTVGAGVSEGEYPNLAWAMNNVAATQVSNTANATVRVIPDPTFDCSDIIGKVFDDKNANGYQDDGEPGIANVRVVTARGLLVTTDAEGRFHVACAAIPQQDHGANFVMKLDERTLPTGYRVTTENPRDVRVTRGKMVKLNFGATIHRVVRLELSGAAFVGDTLDLAPNWAGQVAALPEKLKERPSVLRIAYRPGNESADLGRRRLDALAEQIRSLWKARRKDDERLYPLVIETELEGAK